MRSVLSILAEFTLMLAAGCAAVPPTPAVPTVTAAPLPAPRTTSFSARNTFESPVETPVLRLEAPFLGLTVPRLDGNRLLAGTGASLENPLDIPLAGEPRWVVAAPVPDGSVWVVALTSGQLQSFQIVQGQVQELQLNLASLPAGMPPALLIDGDIPALLVPPPDAAPFTNPISLPDETLVYLDTLGQLRLVRQAEVTTLAVDALPDARLLADEYNRLLFLSGPTDQYPHGALGDQIEAAAITLVDLGQETPETRVIEIEPGDVIEGLTPLWADLDGDGQREIIVTQSNAATGSRLVAYREDGSLLASGAPIGAGFRWQHQLAAGQFIPGGPLEIAAVRTPHLGGVIEIYALSGDQLEIVAELGGYSSHQLGSRNLDGALAADGNGDGQLEVILADQAQTSLAGIQLGEGGLSTVWETPIGGSLRTNLAALTLPRGRLALGVGHSGNMLRLWLPE
ncbi:MAG: hypothetical protein ACK2UW_04295 [Anaerolineales bacterium]